MTMLITSTEFGLASTVILLQSWTTRIRNDCYISYPTEVTKVPSTSQIWKTYLTYMIYVNFLFKATSLLFLWNSGSPDVITMYIKCTSVWTSFYFYIECNSGMCMSNATIDEKWIVMYTRYLGYMTKLWKVTDRQPVLFAPLSSLT